MRCSVSDFSGFWAFSLAVVSSLVPSDHLGRAMMIVNTGVSLATVAAIPLGAFLDEHLGWQAVFLGTAAMAWSRSPSKPTMLPRIEASKRSGLRPLIDTLMTPVIAVGFAVLVLLVTGHFAAFTCVRPMLDRVDGLRAGLLAADLAGFGVASLAGNG